MKNLYLKLNDEFKDFVTSRENTDNLFDPSKTGVKYRICFPEVGYGASVIKFYGSYGYEEDLWELALLSNRDGDGKWRLKYTELVGDDVLGCLTDEQVNKILKFIDKQTKKNNTDKFIECINIIKNKEDNYNGRN